MESKRLSYLRLVLIITAEANDIKSSISDI